MKQISAEDNKELKRLVGKLKENTITQEEKLALLKIVHASIEDFNKLVKEVKAAIPN